MSRKRRNSKFGACGAWRAQRDKMEMAKVNHSGVTNSNHFHLF